MLLKWGITARGPLHLHHLFICGYQKTYTNKYAYMRASEFIIEALDSDAVNELDSFIMNNEELYRRRFMPIITNLKRKIAKKEYDHDKAQKLWMYLVDDAAREYVKEFGSQGQDVSDMFPKETRLQVAKVIADRELENIEQGEYNVTQGTVAPRG